MGEFSDSLRELVYFLMNNSFTEEDSPDDIYERFCTERPEIKLSQKMFNALLKSHRAMEEKFKKKKS